VRTRAGDFPAVRRVKSVGWVERSEIHHLNRNWSIQPVGFAALNPPYESQPFLQPARDDVPHARVDGSAKAPIIGTGDGLEGVTHAVWREHLTAVRASHQRGREAGRITAR